MAGLMKRRCWPACWSARAITPAQRGVAALVPEAGRRPPPLMSRAMAVAEAALAATSGTPRVARARARPTREAGRGERPPCAPPGGSVAPVPGHPPPEGAARAGHAQDVAADPGHHG